MKEFNTTAACVPEDNYMVDLSDRIRQISLFVEQGKYFTINRARQYGKTTTLNLLKAALSESCHVVSMDFEDFSAETFENEDTFCRDFSIVFCSLLEESVGKGDSALQNSIRELLNQSSGPGGFEEKLRLFTLFQNLKKIWDCADKPLVLMIDEVDMAADNRIFLDFLSQLRSHYQKRKRNKNYKTFQSVILAGVTDIKHLKIKIEGDPGGKENSPWNIAVDFNLDMSLSESGIRGMLDEYEADHQTGMKTTEIAKMIRDYTNGYPYLVSRICQLIDTDVQKKCGSIKKAWTRAGVDEAVRMILSEDSALFQSLTAKLRNYPDLRAALRSILMEGTKLAYNAQQSSISQMQMYGFIRNENNTVRIDNRIFETMLYNLFLSDEELKSNVFSREGDLGKNRFVEDGKLNMPLILESFRLTYTQVFGPLENRFKEKDGRELFLLFLKPIINGTGNYYIEAQTRDQTRTDVIIDYLGQQYILELKVWRGMRYNAEGERQIIEYLDYWNLDTGYMLSFNFNRKKEPGMKRVQIGQKVLFEETV